MSDEQYKEEIDTCKSKSEIKREMIALQELGERLLLLNSQQLKRLELPLSLVEAINECKRISSRSAKRRQLQYIGKLMRDIEDPSYIRQYFAEIEMKHNRTTAIHHMLEAWRDRLLSDDIDATTEFIQNYPKIDRQHFRQLVKNARRERACGNPIGAGKLLFRYLHELQTQK